jgi:hypothetical protein
MEFISFWARYFFNLIIFSKNKWIIHKKVVVCADGALFVYIRPFVDPALRRFPMIALQACLVGQAKYPSAA